MNTRMNISTDTETKEEAKKYFKRMGVNMSEGINMLLKKAIKENWRPNCMRSHTPNKETQRVLEEGDKGIGLSKVFDSLEELKKDLGF